MTRSHNRIETSPVDPATLRFKVEVAQTSVACAGATTATVLRRIAHEAGAYAPGIDDPFGALELMGDTVDAVQRWLLAQADAFAAAGYRFSSRSEVVESDALVAWVRSGRGWRGAVIPTGQQHIERHAVGLTVDSVTDKGGETLVVVDPWPAAGDEVYRAGTSPRLDLRAGTPVLMCFWAGWR